MSRDTKVYTRASGAAQKRHRKFPHFFLFCSLLFFCALLSVCFLFSLFAFCIAPNSKHPNYIGAKMVKKRKGKAVRPVINIKLIISHLKKAAEEPM